MKKFQILNKDLLPYISRRLGLASIKCNTSSALLIITIKLLLRYDLRLAGYKSAVLSVYTIGAYTGVILGSPGKAIGFPYAISFSLEKYRHLL